MKKIFILTFYLSSLVSFSQTFILPSSGVQSTFSGGCPVGTCSGTLLDPGGTGNYSNNINQIYQTFCPSTPGNCLQVTFTSFNTESGFDYLTIGNGPAQNSAVFVGAPANASGQIMGTPAVPFSYTSNNSSGCLTFRFRSDFINTRSGFTASLSCVPCAAALPSGNSDACASTFICSNLGINDVSNGPGINPTEGCGGSSCVTGENYSNWYTFSVASSGSLTFTVDPNSNGDDFDYALYGPNVACGGLGAPIRCSYAANTGNTGLGNGASDVSEDVNGNGWTSPLNVTAGQTYKLLVNNWTAGGFGFNLLFGGTAGIGTLPPAVASTSICNGSSTVLTATPVASGGTFTWTPGAINSESITVSPTTTTSYSVAYSMSGCTSTVAVATVTVNNVPTANAGPGTTLTCANPTATLSGSGGGTYAWSGPGITGGGSTANPTINAPGDYSLSVTSSGCTSTISTVSIGQNIAPPVATASNSGTLTCSVPTVTLTGGPASGVSYQWSGPGFSGGTTSQNAVATAAGNYTLTVTDSNNGCSSSTVTTVTQNTTPPVVTASNSTTLTCTTTTAVLSGTGGGTYSWSGPGILSGGNTASPTVNVGGSYTVLVTAANGCTATANTTIIENKTAPVAGASNSSGLTCAITSATLTGSGGGSYVWTGPGIISGASTANPVVNMPGMYSVVVTAANGCTATANTTVSQNTTAPTAGASNSATLTCTAPTATLTGTGGGSYNWTGPGVVSGGTTANPVVNAPGTYSVVVTAANGCTASATTTLTQNASLPVATASNSTILTCTTNTVLLSGGPSSGVSYQWSGPGFSGGTTSQDAIATAPGSYTLVVTNSVNSCTASATTVVSQNTTVPASTATASGDLTCSNSTVTLNSTASSMNYTWTAPAGGVLGSSNSQSTTASGAGGTYSLLVQDPNNGCTYTTTVSVIQNTVIPSGVSAGSNQTLTCNSPTVTLTGSVSSPTNAVVDWGTSVCGTQTTVVTEACAAGIYTLTATDPSNGCIATSTVEVFPNAGAPTVTLSASTLTIDCNNATQSVTVTSTPNTDVTYSWSPAPSSVSASGDVATFSNANTYICTVTNTVTNCSTPVQVVVSDDFTPPAIQISPTQTITCTNPTAVISVTATGTYSWTGSGAIVSGQGTSSITVNTGGDYSVVVTAANGCSATASSHIDADQNIPTVTISASSTNSMITCSNPTVTLTASVSPAATYSYTWAPSGNTGSANESVTGPGLYNVIVLNSATGCTATAVQQFTVIGSTTPPSVSASNTVMPCGSPSVAISANATNVSYNWTTTNGTILSGGGLSTAVAGSTGQYVVTVTDNTNGCTNSATVSVTSIALTAAFTADPVSGTAPLLVNFTNQTSGTGNVYTWNFGDDNNNSSTLTNPNHTYTTSGTYTVLLTVTDASGLCSSTASITIDVFDNFSIIVPNVFTPNGDGANDLFRITTTGVEELNCDIFNRWGLKVYTIKSINDFWDGGGNTAGTYFFILNAKGFDGVEHKQEGFINLFK